MQGRGQSRIEYAIIILLFAVVVGVMFWALVLTPSSIPTADSDLNAIIKYCAERAGSNVKAHYGDSPFNPQQFITCLDGYNYRITR